MKYNYKLKLVALMAAFSGTALENCQAVQVDGGATQGFVGGIVRAAEAAPTGTFYAENQNAGSRRNTAVPPIITPGFATPNANQPNDLPPIVSTRRNSNSLPPIVSQNQNPISLPPIVTPGSASQNMPPIAASDPRSTPDQEPVLPSVPQYQPAGPASLLAPLASGIAYQPTDVIVPGQATNEPIIQANNQVEDVDSAIERVALWSQGQRRSGRSATGIPIYAQSNESLPTRDIPPIVQGEMVAPSIMVPSIIQASSSPVPSPPMVGAQDQLTLPGELNFSVDQSQLGHGNDAVAIDPTYFSAPPSEAPVIANGVSSGCSSCGGGGCSSCGMGSGNVSGCTSCGPGGCFDDGSVANQFGTCGSVYTARRYMIAEALYFNRDDGSIVNSTFGGLNSFDANLGWRFTFGTRNDATNGQEFTYFGTTEMDQTATRVDAGARINSGFVAVGGFGSANLSAFSDATLQTESKDTEIHSLEFNRVKWGWDVVKTFVGLRYINVDDNYRMFSQSSTIPLAPNRLHDGTFEMNTQNNLIGPHVGGELFYDIGNRLSWSLASKAGVYANFNKVDTRLTNDGAQFLNVEDENATLSASLELGLIGHYQLSQQARFRFGYTALWLGDVASVSDNISPFVSPSTGTNTSDSDDMFFHGLSLGFEIFR